MNPIVMCSVSLESYHPYLQPQKVFKNPKFIAFTATCPKSLNSIYGTHKPLGVKANFLYDHVRFFKYIHSFVDASIHSDCIY
jgi:hypothetical protein